LLTRLRQQHLEALGWTFHRVWSTDWFLRRDEEISRAVKAYETAVRRADMPPMARPGPEGPMVQPAGLPADGVRRGARQPVAANRDSIADYSEADLVQMVKWVRADGLLTDDQIVRDVARALGFQRIGGRIDAAIRAVISLAR
jgi:hypothetical protein